jgi:tetratricopeptide (TPR) repeat protein
MNSIDSAESDNAVKSRRPDNRIWTVVLVTISLVAFYQFRDTPQVIMAHWHKAAAQKAEAAKDWPRAFTEIDKAIARYPSGQLYAHRSLIHRGKGVLARLIGNFTEARAEFELALADMNSAIELDPNWRFYRERALIHESLDQFRESVSDWTVSLQTFPDLSSPYASDLEYAEGLNGRAYMRALGNFELDEGLSDIDKALQILPETAKNRFTYLDTRAYLLHLNGDSEQALPILEQCVADAQQSLDVATPAELRDATATLAVLIRHRGEVYEAIGEKNAASADFKRAAELGFNPEMGIR